MSESDELVGYQTVDRQAIRLSRRRLVAGSGVALATTGIASIGAATTHAFQATSEVSPMAEMEGPERAVAFFNLHEAATVDALAYLASDGLVNEYVNTPGEIIGSA
jgi:hypothetical protein